MDQLLVFAHNHVFHGALIAFITAFAVDLHAWNNWTDAAFNFKTASFRWISAAIFGALMSAGIS